MRPLIAVTIGDPAGIGPEIALKAVADPLVHEACRPVLVGGVEIIDAWRARIGTTCKFAPVDDPARIDEGDAVAVLDVGSLSAADLRIGAPDALTGRATLDYAAHAIDLALEGKVAAVVAGPHTQSAIAAAGIPFDGYPRFVAEQTRTEPADAFLMLVGADLRIVHATLHVSLQEALALIDRPRVRRAIEATGTVLRGLGIDRPRIAVAGVNPHAGEGGLFGREEIEVIAPEIAEACARGLDVSGPFGADTMFLDRGYDAYVVMYHDQGHIAAKLFGLDLATAQTIGTPVAFTTVGHGSAAAIAGEGRADPTSMVNAILRMARQAGARTS